MSGEVDLEVTIEGDKEGSGKISAPSPSGISKSKGKGKPSRGNDGIPAIPRMIPNPVPETFDQELVRLCTSYRTDAQSRLVAFLEKHNWTEKEAFDFAKDNENIERWQEEVPNPDWSWSYQSPSRDIDRWDIDDVEI